MTHPETTTPSGEQYTWRGSTVIKVHGARTAANVAGFYTPHLQPGMHLLDCGCGPGTITVGLAEIVAPGEVIAIDREARHIETAKANAAATNVANLRFQTGDVYAMDFADETFDAVFCHALLEHLRDPLAALREMWRVLKPGGVIGVRELDLDTAIMVPEDARLRQHFAWWIRLTRDNGGNAQIGKHLGKLLESAGFQQVRMSATTEIYGEAALTPFVPNASVYDAFNFLIDGYRQRNYASEAELRDLQQAVAEWQHSAESLMAFMRCEAVGYK